MLASLRPTLEVTRFRVHLCSASTSGRGLLKCDPTLPSQKEVCWASKVEKARWGKI